MQLPPEEQLFSCLQLLRQNRADEAAAIAAALARERPHATQSRFAMAMVDRQLGRVESAAASLERLAKELPQNFLVRLEWASTLVMIGRPDEAVPLLEKLADDEPGRVLPLYWLGQAHLRAFRGREAVECFEKVRTLAPQDQRVLQPLASAYLSAGRPDDAERQVRGVLAVRPDDVDSLATLAVSLEHQGRLTDADPVFRRVLRLQQGHPGATAGLARVLQSLGKKDDARDLLRAEVGSAMPPPLIVSTFAGLCETTDDRRACLAAARRGLADASIPAQARCSLCFAAARLLEAEGEYAEAFQCFERGNHLLPSRYDAAAKARFTDELTTTFSAQAIRTMPRARESSRRPVFIVGMPRSGTTLVEQILAAHPRVFAAGELQEVRTIWHGLLHSRGGGVVGGLARLTQADVDTAAGRYLKLLGRLDGAAERVTDKMPHNFELLGLINLCFPDARVIHCVRDPLDTCTSCYTTQLGLHHAYSTDLGTLGHAYGQYRRLMNHWRSALDLPVLDVVYEDLVADLDTHAHRIVEHAGLPWDDGCLRFHEAERTIITASVDQARRPIYTSSVGRWRRYADALGTLREALAAAGVPLEFPAGN